MIIQSYFWEFGDGRTSTEKAPVHVYQMPGIYNGTLTIVDSLGNTYTVTFSVRVFDNDLLDVDGVHATYTNRCYRAAILAKHGTGIVEWGGEHWVWPEAYVGAQKGLLKSGENVSLVLNRMNGRFYRLGIPELWLDRESNYGGYEIPCHLRIKEHLAVAGEQNMIEHVETHITIRPFSEEYRGDDGYTDDGLRSAQQLALSIFKDGEQVTPYSKVQDAPIYGDYMYGRRAKAKRLQLEINTTASAFRITSVKQIHENSDERVGPKYAVASESTWQREFGTPDLWMVRNRTNPLRNRATGLDLSGTYSGLVTGPDGVAQSAVDHGAGFAMNVTLPSISVATLSFWLKNMSLAGNAFVFPQFTVGIATVGGVNYLRIVGAFGTVDQALAWNGIDWVFLAIAIDSTYLRVYENGTIKGTIPNPGTGSFGGATVLMGSLSASLFDVRRTPRVISQSALGYYYDNVINEAGNILPMQR